MADICGNQGPRINGNLMVCWRPKGHASQVHQAHRSYAIKGPSRYIPIWTDTVSESSAKAFFDLLS